MKKRKNIELLVDFETFAFATTVHQKTLFHLFEKYEVFKKSEIKIETSINRIKKNKVSLLIPVGQELVINNKGLTAFEKYAKKIFDSTLSIFLEFQKEAGVFKSQTDLIAKYLEFFGKTEYDETFVLKLSKRLLRHKQNIENDKFKKTSAVFHLCEKKGCSKNSKEKQHNNLKIDYSRREIKRA